MPYCNACSCRSLSSTAFIQDSNVLVDLLAAVVAALGSSSFPHRVAVAAAAAAAAGGDGSGAALPDLSNFLCLGIHHRDTENGETGGSGGLGS